MKRTISLILTVCLLIACAPFSFAAEVIAIDASIKILVPASPTPAENYAARLLREELGKVFGAAVETTTAPDGPYIAVGSASRADVSDVAVDGYRIQAIDGNIHIGGTGVRGLQCGVCRFLEDFCGRKVYAADCVVLPQKVSRKRHAPACRPLTPVPPMWILPSIARMR